jgi:hypothetical protein
MVKATELKAKSNEELDALLQEQQKQIEKPTMSAKRGILIGIKSILFGSLTWVVGVLTTGALNGYLSKAFDALSELGEKNLSTMTDSEIQNIRAEIKNIPGRTTVKVVGILTALTGLVASAVYMVKKRHHKIADMAADDIVMIETEKASRGENNTLTQEEAYVLRQAQASGQAVGQHSGRVVEAKGQEQGAGISA